MNAPQHRARPGASPTRQGASTIRPDVSTSRPGANTMPGFNSGPTDEQRAAELRKHKIFVTGLLVLAAVIFLACSWWQSQPGDTPAWVGYVRAAAEAGMVGGLADWFAVTALFRHPMGLPIPHTALIRRKKTSWAIRCRSSSAITS